MIDAIPFAHKPIKEKRHNKNLKEKQEEELLTTLPPPAPSQINAVGIAIDKVVQEFGLHNESLDQRLEIKHAMESACQHKLPGAAKSVSLSTCLSNSAKTSELGDTWFLESTVWILGKTL